MASEKANALIDLLVERTEDGTITWQSTESPSIFQVILKKGVIRITRNVTPSSLSTPPKTSYKLTMLNDAGEIVDTLSPAKIESNDSKPMVLKFKELYERARSNAIGSQQLLNQLILELQPPKTKNMPKPDSGIWS